MNPFEWQAELARQWLGMVGEAFKATTAAATTPPASAFAPATWMWPWLSQPSVLSPFMPAPPSPVSGLFPWMTWPFAPAASSPAAWQMATAAWPSLMPSWPLTPWQNMGFQFPFFPQSPFFPWSGSVPWMSSPWSMTPWGMTGMTAVNPFFAWNSAPPSPAVMIEQVATAYRTASGHAVAAILGPMGVALGPRTMGEPWWQQAPKRDYA